MNASAQISADSIEMPVTIPVEAYLSVDYIAAERENLWRRVWQVACRQEEIPNVGDYVTYDILDDSIIVVRSSPDTIRAYHNVCQHRGRRLTEGCGHAKRLACKFHGWKWRLDGTCAEMLRGEAYGDCLKPEDASLSPVAVDVWGGFVFINMDTQCEPLSEFLDEAKVMLDPFELGAMTYSWRQWVKFPCNWKVALEAFNEGYHLLGTHPQLARGTLNPTWTRPAGRHGCFGSNDGGNLGGATSAAGGAADLRITLPEVLNQIWAEMNAITTPTMVGVANSLIDELPEGTPPDEVLAHFMARSMEEDGKNGVQWPTIDPAHFASAGLGWHVFPNTVIVHGPTFALCYRARPDGYDPDSCIFEAYALQRFAPGQEPRPENLNKPTLDEDNWRKVLCQDFSNMGQVQSGMKSLGFRGPRPHPIEERTIINFHRNLAHYMGRGDPVPMR